jgi:hypothetical protein
MVNGKWYMVHGIRVWYMVYGRWYTVHMPFTKVRTSTLESHGRLSLKTIDARTAEHVCTQSEKSSEITTLLPTTAYFDAKCRSHMWSLSRIMYMFGTSLEPLCCSVPVGADSSVSTGREDAGYATILECLRIRSWEGVQGCRGVGV